MKLPIQAGPYILLYFGHFSNQGSEFFETYKTENIWDFYHILTFHRLPYTFFENIFLQKKRK